MLVCPIDRFGTVMASILFAPDIADLDVEQELQCVRNTLRKPSLQWKTLRTGVTSTVEYLVELRKSEAKKLAPSSWMQVGFCLSRSRQRRHCTQVTGVSDDPKTSMSRLSFSNQAFFCFCR